MDKIEVMVLNPSWIEDIEKMTAVCARITQHGEAIKSLKDFMELYEKPMSEKLHKTLCNLPHPTLQKFGVLNVVVVGASRRFLQQITRHQNEVKFMSASLQYSDFSGGEFVVPYSLLGNRLLTRTYELECRKQLQLYNELSEYIPKDDCGYCVPVGLRNVLIISATPYQWKHMISQRICRRNTAETRYVMLRIWEKLYGLSAMFRTDDIVPKCCYGRCMEGKMSCGTPFDFKYPCTPSIILATDFDKIVGGQK